ncbi:methyltransferase domain-containing protein [Cyanobacterium aponinum AL20118]|uniref:Methyltransferase domain-containing protein n=1 Tax=Cyanobacterium aponinum AL20115 TaxID=3090662 RepID=A0AAF1C143_9CHRO|nr:methyltransferase domain-containing protein [Cyanobacterium aponinum]WPF88252.1 methyltransferase domain-containing protein [Cyanobacterium aponinum AL20115]
MIKKVYVKLKSEGVNGLFQTLYNRFMPIQLKYFPNCKSFFQGKVGLEIGGPSSIFEGRGFIPIYSVAKKIDNVNFAHNTVWEGSINEGNSFIFNKSKTPGCQYVAEASNLEFIRNSSYDFVLSSHCIEHLANPIQGLSEWIRVLKENGLLVLVVPHKDGTFDHRRPVTSLEHLIQDFDNQIDESDMTHLEEILRLHDLSKDPGAGDFQSFQERSKRNKENRCLHQHVVDTRLVIEVVNYMGLQILAVEFLLPFHIVVICEKVSQDQTASNEKFRGKDESLCWISPFPSDLTTNTLIV